MARRFMINMGFITNSSSCVYSFPPEVLAHPKVQSFIKRYEIHNGYVGDDLWYRSRCSSFLVTDEQKKEALNELSGNEYGCSRNFSLVEDEGCSVIYGDEYSDITSTLCCLMSDVARELKVAVKSVDFN